MRGMFYKIKKLNPFFSIIIILLVIALFIVIGVSIILLINSRTSEKYEELQTCQYNGLEYQIGDVFYNESKCEECECTIDGILCKQIECSDTTNTGSLTSSDVINSTTEQTTIHISSNSSDILIFECIDCWLAPMGKTRSLSSSYSPSVIPTNLLGGGSVASDTQNVLTQMFTHAKNKGLDLFILSAYRSFETQQATFEYWVGQEVAKGYSRTDAEVRANTYSAKPGHSEHQLGTVVDLKCNGCASFDNSVENQKIYEYLEQNAHNFGFIISYPKNSQHLTGYVYEPWHVRYIGIDLAKELFDTGYLNGNGNYLEKFLLEKGLY